MAKILLMDDDGSICEYVELILADAGHDVTTASDGFKGMEAFKTKHFDLVIVDIFMPEMEGIETIQELARLDKYLPIIAVSGGISDRYPLDYLKMTKKFGAQITLRKPLRSEKLKFAVHECLHLPSSERGNPVP